MRSLGPVRAAHHRHPVLIMVLVFVGLGVTWILSTMQGMRSLAIDDLPLVVTLLIFAAAAAVVWLAGIRLSTTTDVLATRLGLGEALGGLILLAIATNLPEIAITVSAALANNLGIAIGNILGGIAIQTVVLAVMDAVGLGRDDGLTYRSASL